MNDHGEDESTRQWIQNEINQSYASWGKRMYEVAEDSSLYLIGHCWHPTHDVHAVVGDTEARCHTVILHRIVPGLESNNRIICWRTISHLSSFIAMNGNQDKYIGNQEQEGKFLQLLSRLCDRKFKRTLTTKTLTTITWVSQRPRDRQQD